MALYETKDDLIREVQFITKIEQTFKCKCSKLPIHWRIDAFIHRNNEVVACAEFKTRTIPSDKYDTAVISERKVNAGYQVANYFIKKTKIHKKYEDMPYIYFVRFTNVDMWCKLTKELIEKSEKKLMQPKNHKNEPMETYIFLPIEKFNKF